MIKADIKLEDYKKCLFEGIIKDVKMTGFQSYKHKNYTQIVEKKALDYTDTKRIILDDRINTRVWGHWKDRE